MPAVCYLPERCDDDLWVELERWLDPDLCELELRPLLLEADAVAARDRRIPALRNRDKSFFMP